MSSYRLHSLVSLILMIAILWSEMEHVRSDVFQYGQKGEDVNNVRQYCGRTLSNTLQILCGSYNSPFKKSNEEMEMDDYMAFSYDLHPYKSNENAKKMLRFRRNSGGIYEECCLKSCTTEELKTYCGSP